MARSLNRAQLIGNLTRDPELRYTPTGKAVCSFAIATNRYWTTESGEKKEEADFHNIVAWGKLAELCSQFMGKGRKVFVEGRMQTRLWTGQDGAQKSRTEVVIDDMILLDNKGVASTSNVAAANESAAAPGEQGQKPVKAAPKHKKGEEGPVKGGEQEEVSPDDIPF
jgi:single-strand DNA-binding protein